MTTKLQKLQIQITKKEEALLKEKQRLHNIINNIGFGYGMRAYSRIKKINFSKETKLTNELSILKDELQKIKSQQLF